MIRDTLWTHEFRRDEHRVFLNHAGVAPWPRRTVEAVRRFAEDNHRNGPLHYDAWLAVEAELRRRAQALLNAPSAADIALLKNTSEGLSIVAYGLDWRSGDNVVTSNQEFPSNRIVWESLADQGVELREADLESAATPEDALCALVDDRTRMLTVSSVQYATGLRMDLERLGSFCTEHGVLFCVDAIQSLGALAFDVQAARADFVVADGHKWLLGPEGLALFYARSESRARLLLRQYGWHMVESMGDFERRAWRAAASARRFECGSPNMLGIHALGASLSLLLEVGIDTIEDRVRANSRYLFQRLGELPGVRLLSRTEPQRTSGIVAFAAAGRDPQEILRGLRERGIICAARGGGVRFSPHFYTPREGLARAVAALAECL